MNCRNSSGRLRARSEVELRMRHGNTGISELLRRESAVGDAHHRNRAAAGPARAADPTTGNSACEDLKVTIDSGSWATLGLRRSNEGWVWVQKATPRSRSSSRPAAASSESRVATIDYPTTHDTHDHNTIHLVGSGVRSTFSATGTSRGPTKPSDHAALEIEWETGIHPFENSGDGASPFYPREMWASPGDRYWAEGHWVFDCGHTLTANHPAEIHPPRAAAAMRQTTYPPTAPARRPYRDHGRHLHPRPSWFVTEVLYCEHLQDNGIEDVECPSANRRRSTTRTSRSTSAFRPDRATRPSSPGWSFRHRQHAEPGVGRRGGRGKRRLRTLRRSSRTTDDAQRHRAS